MFATANFTFGRVHALGAVLYDMVVGRPPFMAPTPEATADPRQREHPQPAAYYDPSLNRQLDSAMSRALWRSPDQSWASARAFEGPLER
jgi:serine/threonine-protein kinase